MGVEKYLPFIEFQISKSVKVMYDNNYEIFGDITRKRWYYEKHALYKKTHAILEAYLEMPLKWHKLERMP